VPLDKARLGLFDQPVLTPSQVDSASRSTVTVHAAMPGLTQGKHELKVVFAARPSRQLHLKVEDSTAHVATTSERLPREESDDNSRALIQGRQAHVQPRKDGPASLVRPPAAYWPARRRATTPYTSGLNTIPICVADTSISTSGSPVRQTRQSRIPSDLV